MTYDPMAWAEGLIQQLPEHHEGAASWLLNHGNSPRAHALRAVRSAINDEPKTADVVDRDEREVVAESPESIKAMADAIRKGLGFDRASPDQADALAFMFYAPPKPSRPATAGDVTQLWAAVDELKGKLNELACALDSLGQKLR